MIYDPSYLDVHRTDDIVLIHIVAGRWRDTATKKSLYQRVVELLTEEPGLRREDVQIILSPNDRDDWSFGNGVGSYLTE
jgi:phenylpyruvate tautomerase PptA (4-oxalocrotonate tautomerase family)